MPSKLIRCKRLLIMTFFMMQQLLPSKAFRASWLMARRRRQGKAVTFLSSPFPSSPIENLLRGNAPTTILGLALSSSSTGNNLIDYDDVRQSSSSQTRTLRHLHVKQLLQEEAKEVDGNSIENTVSLLDGQSPKRPSRSLYQLKVTVCPELRSELKLSGREKRGRVFIETNSDAAQSLRGLKRELHAFFRALRKGTYVLTAEYPPIEIGRDIPTTAGADGDTNNEQSPTLGEPWIVQTDEDVIATFQRADAFFAQHSEHFQRPTLVLNVQRDPNAPPPPPPPPYLENMADPSSSPTMTMLSFYSFPPEGISNPQEFGQTLKSLWKPFGALGRVYVAEEGVNAQMSVPTNVLDRFRRCCLEYIPELGEYMENGLNIDPVPVAMEEFRGENPPFTNLHVRVRKQVVADGLDKPYEWRNAGYDMPPLEWHERLQQAIAARENNATTQAPIVLDFRNDYETSVGRFEGAEPLGTVNFRESWQVVNERLANVPKDTPIMMYCTGGIRCVKAGAYVTQELGFKNVSRLAGGIIAYDRTLSEQARGEESLFKGTNFVFDGRLGRQITDDALGSCLTCGANTALVSNCRNDNCHKRMVQCEQCRTSLQGTCSDACYNRLLNGQMRPLRNKPNAAATDSTSAFTSLDQYSLGHSTPPPSVYNEMELNTRVLIPSGSHMVSGAAQGRLLSQLASLTREGRILEIGTFTGYATACLLEGANNVGRLIGPLKGSRDSGPYVLSLERDRAALDLATAHLKVISDHGLGEFAAEELGKLRADAKSLVPPSSESLVTLVSGDVVTCELLQVSDALATIEEIAAGRGDMLPAPFDMVFIDADKTRLVEYAEACLSSDRLLKKGGLMIVDNVLWKGLVLEASTGTFSSLRETEDTDEAELRKNRRARKLAAKMHRFNSAMVNDDRAEVLVLPMRDGLSVIRKK